MNDMNLRDTIVPKSDQLNADDLIGTTKVITITDVRRGSADQPVVIHYEGEDGRPYKPCKSMRRVLIYCWGDDGKSWIGKSMQLYCDPEVKFGGVKVGGIRISHLSNIETAVGMQLTATRGKRDPYRVDPLNVSASKLTDEQVADIEALIIETGSDRAQLIAFYGKGKANDLSDLPSNVYGHAIVKLTEKKAIQANIADAPE